MINRIPGISSGLSLLKTRSADDENVRVFSNNIGSYINNTIDFSENAGVWIINYQVYDNQQYIKLTKRVEKLFYYYRISLNFNAGLHSIFPVRP